MKGLKLEQFVAPCLTLVLLAGVAAQNLSRVSAEDAEPYHRRVRQVAKLIPYHIDDWVGVDVPVPAEAQKLLKPNILFNRRYVNVRTQLPVSLLLVQSRDARDLAGHYPPNCYVAHGWTRGTSVRRQWTVDGVAVPGFAYEFERTRLGQPSRMIVYNFMILPDGRLVPDMHGVRSAAGDQKRRVFGAAQIQVVFSASVPEAQRDEILQTLVGANMQIIRTICQGAVP